MDISKKLSEAGYPVAEIIADLTVYTDKSESEAISARRYRFCVVKADGEIYIAQDIVESEVV